MKLTRDVVLSLLDTALCNGNGEPACETCARRLAERPVISWMVTPMAEGNDCELRLTGKYA
jgi:hypothetical protein